MISTSFTEGMDALLNVIEMWLNVIEILLIDFNQDVIALDWNTTSINFNHNQSRSIITGIFWRSLCFPLQIRTGKSKEMKITPHID